MITTDRITAGHLKRKAYLYVRQSTLYQTEQNPESLQRQYDFRSQALSLGWHEDQIVTLDEDLGQSGAETTRRTDFQRLVADVGLGQVGIVLSLEISRLARNSADWHRLLELCAMTDTEHQERWAAYLGVPVEYKNSVGMKMVLIPPGEFLMGSPQEEIAKLLTLLHGEKVLKSEIEGIPNEGPQHPVRNQGVLPWRS